MPEVHLARSFVAICLLFAGTLSVWATPANKAGLEKYYDRFLVRSLARCTTCHLPSSTKDPQSLDEFPHNPFGARLRALANDLSTGRKSKDISERLASAAQEDADGDGVPNQLEILLGHNPGDRSDTPGKDELNAAALRVSEFKLFQQSYRWRPFDPVVRPEMPRLTSDWGRNPVDRFIAVQHEKRGLTPRSEAAKSVLLRRVYADVIGLFPSEAERLAFLADQAPDAYEKLVDRLLDDPRYGERWGRHWMDIWRYSDWGGWSGGNQIRDSKPHIWRWRDWIIESLNADKGYDRMILEMLAGDELAPENPETLRATGYLVRNYKMLSREQWLDDTIKHTSQAFLGITMGCAKCHDHMYDPISQADYYQLRAIFEPHQVRTDRVPGETDTSKNGLVRVYDTMTNTPTYFYIRGDERKPDTNRVMTPGLPGSLTNAKANWQSAGTVTLPRVAAFPDQRPFVIHDLVLASESALAAAERDLVKAKSDPKLSTNTAELALKLELVRAKHLSLRAILETENAEALRGKESLFWKAAATNTVVAQRQATLAQARLTQFQANENKRAAQKRVDENAARDSAESKKPENEAATAAKNKKETDKLTKELESATQKLAEAEKALAQAEKDAALPATTAFTARAAEVYPETSSGRRLALARWIANANNPLTARVAINHIWLRHFGRGLVGSPADFGRNGVLPSHPELLDWLAAELMARDWSMKSIHRLILTSATYRMDSTPEPGDAQRDPDNIYLWRSPTRRMEAEAIRDNLLYSAGDLDQRMGGPEIDHNLGLKSKRRSVYLQIAPEKEVEFLKIFDGPTVTECYQRRPSVVPQQALALANSELALNQARQIAHQLIVALGERGNNEAFVNALFSRLLGRDPTPAEMRLCQEFLDGRQNNSSEFQLVANPPKPKEASEPAGRERARAHLVLVLLNHHEFVTIR